MLILDGSLGEGGGQILRTALGLSLVTGKPFTIEGIRAGREKPGLLRQHLTAVTAAAELGHARVEGAALRSPRLVFAPGEVRPGDYTFSVGTAGSATLVLQAVLPALLTAKGPSRLTLEGGTHNPWAPPYDFLEKTFLPLVQRMGPRITCSLERRGFYPAGGGRFTVAIEPSVTLQPLILDERGPLRALRAAALVAALPPDIAERELRTLQRALAPEACSGRTLQDSRSAGPGNVVSVEIESAALTEVVTGFGEKNLRAEAVAKGVAEEVRAYLDSGAAAGEYLADQLLIPLALAGAGSFTSGPLSAHATTNIEVIRRFLDVDFRVEPAGKGVRVSAASAR